MKKYVDFDKDIKEPFESVLKGAYEKANIWGFIESPEVGMRILDEEIEEADHDVSALDSLLFYHNKHTQPSAGFTEQEVSEIKGLTISAICELLQVLAVCNKYWPDTFRGVDNE